MAAQPFRHGGGLLPFIATVDALIVLAVLQSADWLTTARLLSHGGREANPVMAWAMRKVGLTTDFAGNPVGASPDRGAYERQGA